MNYLKMQKEDVCNGSGLRCTVWISGCEHHCEGCFNPESWDFSAGKPLDMKGIEEIYSELEKTHVEGITLTGGDPLHPKNVVDVFFLLDSIRLRYPQKTIWLYTGYTWEEIFSKRTSENRDLDAWRIFQKDTVLLCDVLVDGKFLPDLKNPALKFRGSENQRLIDVRKSTLENKIVLVNENK